MFAPARRRCAQSLAKASNQHIDSIPPFLLPAFSRPAVSRTFTTTAPCQSKIGSQALSVPQGVTFKVVAPSTKNTGSRVQAMSTVHITGPLGELSMNIPPYVNIDQDPALAGPTLTIQNERDAKQKAMWGTTLARTEATFLLLTRTQASPAHTSKTTSSVLAKATALFFASSASVSVPQSRTPRPPLSQNTLARSS
jgi:hypothetical protein